VEILYNPLMINGLALGLIAFFAYRGLRKGLYPVFLGIIAIILGYLAAFYGAKPFGNYFMSQMGVKPLWAYALGGFGSFGLIQIFFMVPAFLIQWRVKQRQRQGLVSRRYWLFGGLLGSIQGLFYAILLVWMILFFRMGTSPPDAAAFSPGISEKITKGLMRKGTQSFLKRKKLEDKTLHQVLASLISQPGLTVHSIKRITENPQLEKMLQEPTFIEALQAKDPRKVTKHRAFQALVGDPDFIESTEQLGLIDVQEGLSRGEFNQRFSKSLIDLHSRVRRVKDHPEVMKILEDPEFQKKLEEKQIFSLLNDDGFNLILELVLRPEEGLESDSIISSLKTWDEINHSPDGLSLSEFIDFDDFKENEALFTEKIFKKAKKEKFLWGNKKDFLTDDTKSLFTLAERGHASAQFRLGFKYANGWGLAFDPDAALKWISKAAEQNYTEANFVLGAMKLTGWHTPQKKNETWRGIKRAADQKFAPAQYCVALIQIMKFKDPIILQEAKDLMIEAASRGHTPSFVFLGIMHLSGFKTKKNLSQAYMWFKLSEAHGAKFRSRFWAKFLPLLNSSDLEKAQRAMFLWKDQKPS